jgi:L-idonate 5-dehydrogenase
VRPLITHTLPLDKATEAFELASDRSQAIKAQIAFA